MKNKLILGAAFLLAAITESLACTNLIVGKGASVDGSVIVSYSADSYGMFGELYHYPAGMHEKGTMRDIYDWDSGKYLGQIKEARQTYNVVVLFWMNRFHKDRPDPRPLCSINIRKQLISYKDRPVKIDSNHLAGFLIIFSSRFMGIFYKIPLYCFGKGFYTRFLVIGYKTVSKPDSP